MKKKNCAMIKYKKKDGDQMVDSVSPASCHLTEFHALFMYPDTVTVVSLIT